MSRPVRLVGLARLAHGESRAFVYDDGGKTAQGFVLRIRDDLVAYRNVCPHWNVDLDLGFGDFYADDLDAIFCRNHGALFSPTTGECTFGPCLGQRLEPLEVRADGEDLVVDVPGD